jgi:hypothetical protein
MYFNASVLKFDQVLHNRKAETEAVFARLAFFLPVSAKDAGNPSRVNSNPSEF